MTENLIKEKEDINNVLVTGFFEMSEEDYFTSLEGDNG